MKKETYEKKLLTYPLPKLHGIAQELFNRFVRERDSDEYCFTCISCDTPKDFTQRQAGHYFSVGSHPHMRYDADNVHAQCVHCNKFKHGNLIGYREGLIKKIGKESFEKLEIRAGMGGRIDRLSVIELILKLKYQ